jgi:hypothetical protein
MKDKLIAKQKEYVLKLKRTFGIDPNNFPIGLMTKSMEMLKQLESEIAQLEKELAEQKPEKTAEEIIERIAKEISKDYGIPFLPKKLNYTYYDLLEAMEEFASQQCQKRDEQYLKKEFLKGYKKGLEDGYKNGFKIDKSDL